MPGPAIEIARKLLAKDDFEKAFEALRRAMPDALADELLALEGNYNGVKNAHLSRGLPFEKYQETTASIRFALFNLLQRVENQIHSRQSPDSRHFIKIPHPLLTEMLGKIGRQARYAVAELRDHVQEGFIRSPRLQRRVETGARTERKGLDEASLLDLVRFLFEGIAPGLGERERDYLRWLAVLPPRAFSADLLARLFRIPGAERPAWEADMDDLEKKGVPLHRGRAYGLHRLMREVIRETEACTVDNCKPVIQAVTNLLKVDQAKDNPVEKFPWIDFGEALMTVFEEYDSTEISELKNNLAWIFEDFGHYERAKALYEAALESAVKNFGNEHPNVAVRQNNLAFVLKASGEEKAAIQLMQKAYALRVKLLGPEHPSTKSSAKTLRDWGAEPAA